MCYTVYIATDKVLELGRFVPEQTTLFFEKVNGDESVLRPMFSKTNIYYVGSSTGCSCGLDYYMPNFDDPEHQNAKRSPQAFLDFLMLTTQAHEVEFYCCWYDDALRPIKQRQEIDIRGVSLRDNYFGLVENEFITFLKQTG